MCGVYGFVGFRDDNLLKKMGQTLSHRGPDDQDELSEGKISIGYRRLAIIDIGGSYQPLFNEDKSIALIFNGEVYNYKSLKEHLTKHRFATQGDGESIIHWYESHGTLGFRELNGIFGFALYDKKAEKLLLVRDHLGIKPLYYFANQEILIFASEIKAILPVLKAKNMAIRPNEGVIKRYLLSRLHDNNEETFFEGIKRVPAGGFLEWNLKTNKFQTNNYWHLTSSTTLNQKSDPENIAKFRELFLEAVKLQLMSEVPLGTALSGGLDSSAVVMAVNQQIRNGGIGEMGDISKVIGERQKTFSAIFPHEINNEESYINEIVQQTNVDSQKVIPARQDLWQEINQLIYHQDEPMISSGPFAQWEVMKLAAKNKIKVMLDGQGADEMLAGYDAYFFVYLRELFDKGQYIQFLKELIGSLDILWKYLKEKLEYLTGAKTNLNIKELFTFRDTGTPRTSNNDLNKRLLEDITSSSLPSLLRYEDKNSMAFSIEARVPFLDYRLVEFVASLPSNYKIRNGWNKWIMRDALKDFLPEKILKRRWKVGFTTPEVHWLRQSKEEIRKFFGNKSFAKRPYFNVDKIKEKYLEFVDGKNDESMVFWRIINLELWLKIFIDPYV